METSKNDRKPTVQLLFGLLIFGTIGIVKQFFTVPNGFLSALRGLGAALTLGITALFLGKRLSLRTIRKKLLLLALSGVALGANWIFLFDSYPYVGVATASLVNYMAPMAVILISPLLFKERISFRKGLCVIAAFIGAFLISGIFSGENGGEHPEFLKGLILVGIASLCYMAFILFNKFITDISAFDRGTVQLFFAGLSALVYVLIFERETLPQTVFDLKTVLFTVVFVLVHTALSYGLYFAAVGRLSAQKVSLMSYLDPAVTVTLSFLVLREQADFMKITGIILIMGGAFLSDVVDRINIKTRREAGRTEA